MRTQEIKVQLKDGKIKIECDGFYGQECDSIASIEQSLGTIISREATQEAYVHNQELPEFVKIRS